MSYEIVYDRRVLKLGEDKYILMVNSGSNNCWEDNRKPEKNWTALKNISKTSILLSENDINDIADSFYNSEIAKSRMKFFKEGELTKYLKAGLKKSFTLEEAISWDSWYNKIIIYNYDKSESSDYQRTSDLLKTIELLESNGEKFNISFNGRDFKAKKKEYSDIIKSLKNPNCYYVLYEPSSKGYLISVNSKYSYTYTRYINSNQILKFKSLEEVEEFKKNSENKLDSFKVKVLEKRDKVYCISEDKKYYIKKLTSRRFLYSRDIDEAKLFKTEKEAKKYLNKLENLFTLTYRNFEVIKLNKESFFTV